MSGSGQNWLTKPDTINALLFLIFGGGVVAYTVAELPIGNLRRLGPGGFSFALGLLLIFFGLVLLIRSFRSAPEQLKVSLRTPVCLLGALLAFGIVVPLFGALPAIAVLVLISTLAERRLSLLASLVLVAALCAIAWLIFDVVLDMSLKMLDWPL